MCGRLEVPQKIGFFNGFDIIIRYKKTEKFCFGFHVNFIFNTEAK